MLLLSCFVDFPFSYCRKKRHSHGHVVSALFYECSNQHVPGFITQAEELKAKGVDEILLVSGMLSAFFCVP